MSFKFISAIALLMGVVMTTGGCVLEDLTSIGDALAPPSPGDAARMMFDPHDPDNRREGTTLLASSPFGGNEAYVSAYRDMVQNEADETVLAAAIRALARHGEASDAKLVAVHLESESRQVRWEAAKGLQRLHDPEVVAGLLAIVRNPQTDGDVREAAVTALGQYPEDRVVRALFDALRSRELAVNVAARQSLQSLTGQDHGLSVRQWREWYEPAMKADVAFADQQQYRYPVYSREETWLDKINIFSQRQYESPNAPAGLRDETVRRTYEDSDSGDAAGDPGSSE